MARKNKKFERKHNQLKNYRKKLKYFEILGIKNNSKILTKKLGIIKYNFFRKIDFMYKLPRFPFYRRKIFSNELAEIMFGFGDSENPLKKTVLFVEKLIVNFFHNLVCSLTYIAFWRLKKRPTIDDLLFCMRNKNREMSKITYLLKMKVLIERIMGSHKKRLSFKEKALFPLKMAEIN